MTPKPLELRRWFVTTTAVAGLLTATVCMAIVWHALPSSSPAWWALDVLYLGAGAGLVLVFGRLLPIVLVKMWPSLDA